jgi:hypothetical protein
LSTPTPRTKTRNKNWALPRHTPNPHPQGQREIRINKNELLLAYSERHPRYAYARAFVTPSTEAGGATEETEHKLELWQVILTQTRELYLVCFIVKEPVGTIPSTEEDPISLGRCV